MSGSNLYASILSNFAGQSVLCVGDAVLDRYVHGAVTRISPEAPIPVLLINREAMTLGGAGNTVHNITTLGGKVIFSTVVGEDAAAKDMVGLLSGLGCDTDGLIIDAKRPTTVKTRFVSGSQQLLRADHETTGFLSPDIERRIIDHAVAAIAEVKSVVISDYAKGVVTRQLAEAVIAAAAAKGIPVIVDSKPASFPFFKGATVLKPNRRELALATGLPVDNDDEVTIAAKRLMDISGAHAIVATRSEQGMSVVEAGGNATHLRMQAREVFDVSGAGDTVAATLALALAAGASLVQAAELANYAGGIVVGKMGTATVHVSELDHAAHQKTRDASSPKIQTWDDAADTAERWRGQGVKVGFTNGVFDLLHPGHISILAQARRACDRLIVGINSDESVRRLKGPTRPVNGSMARAAVLAGLADVDAVVVFEEDTPKNIIEALRPDVLVKGADYTIHTVVGADFVQSYGGVVILAELQEGHSTTGTIKRMQG